MRTTKRHLLALATTGCAALLAGDLVAQDAAPTGDAGKADKVRFAPPTRLRAGDEYLGAGRAYPSPTAVDLDGDKHLDVVIGDLGGRVTIARGGLSDGGVMLSAEKPINGSDDKPLKFNNW